MWKKMKLLVDVGCGPSFRRYYDTVVDGKSMKWRQSSQDMAVTDLILHTAERGNEMALLPQKTHTSLYDRAEEHPGLW